MIIIFVCQPLNGEVPESVSAYLAQPTKTAGEDGWLPDDKAVALPFVRGVVDNWEEILVQIKNVAPDSRRQVLVAIAAEFLAPRDYIEFIDAVSTKAGDANGGVTNEMIAAILDAAMIKNGFLGYRYQDPDVASAIAKLKSCAVARMPGRWEQFFTAVQDGSVRATVIARQSREGGSLPEDLDNPSVLDE